VNSCVNGKELKRVMLLDAEMDLEYMYSNRSLDIFINEGCMGQLRQRFFTVIGLLWRVWYEQKHASIVPR